MFRRVGFNFVWKKRNTILKQWHSTGPRFWHKVHLEKFHCLSKCLLKYVLDYLFSHELPIIFLIILSNYETPCRCNGQCALQSQLHVGQLQEPPAPTRPGRLLVCCVLKLCILQYAHQKLLHRARHNHIARVSHILTWLVVSCTFSLVFIDTMPITCMAHSAHSFTPLHRVWSAYRLGLTLILKKMQIPITTSNKEYENELGRVFCVAFRKPPELASSWSPLSIEGWYGA